MRLETSAPYQTLNANRRYGDQLLGAARRSAVRGLLKQHDRDRRAELPERGSLLAIEINGSET